MITLPLVALLSGVTPVAMVHPEPLGVFADTACIVMGMSVEGRPSPLDSVSFGVGNSAVKVCYGRPSARGRTMIGGNAVPYGRLWRTGANEPTMIHTTAPITVAGVEIEAGTYSLYSIPNEDEWTIIINRSITQWGHEGRYTAEVEAQEVGRGTARSERLAQPLETLTFRAAPTANRGATLSLEWERTRVVIPIEPGGP